MHNFFSKKFFYYVVLLSLNFFYIAALDQSKEITLNQYLQEINYVSHAKSSEDIEIKNKIKRVVILCPAYLVTGGVENLCQIYASLKKLGYEVYMLWTTSNFPQISKKYKNGQCLLSKIDQTFLNTAYISNYDVNYLDKDILLDEETLVIVPEIWIDIISFFENAKKAISWLSISNFDGCGKSTICKNLIAQKQLNYLNCVHLSQAPWIQKILKSWGANSFLLGDYISKIYFTKNIINKSEKLIAYFPRKGGELASKFVNKYSDLDYIKLENFTQNEMIFALDISNIYIDFGSFPGKDRIPREALLRNCVIFIHNQGCATDTESFPIDDYFRFSEQDVLDGTLYEKIKIVLADYENMQKKQSFMRNQILQEQDLFEKNIKDFFGNPAI